MSTNIEIKIDIVPRYRIQYNSMYCAQYTPKLNHAVSLN